MVDEQFIPELIVHDGAAALDFYASAFGATEIHRMTQPESGKLIHGELSLDGHRLFVCNEFSADEGGTCKSPQTLGGTGVRITLLVDDADVAVQRVLAAGGQAILPVTEMFWGARYAKIRDPFGHEWGINQQVRLQSIDETESAAEEFFDRKPREGV